MVIMLILEIVTENDIYLFESIYYESPFRFTQMRHIIIFQTTFLFESHPVKISKTRSDHKGCYAFLSKEIWKYIIHNKVKPKSILRHALFYRKRYDVVYYAQKRMQNGFI